MGDAFRVDLDCMSQYAPSPPDYTLPKGTWLAEPCVEHVLQQPIFTRSEQIFDMYEYLL